MERSTLRTEVYFKKIYSVCEKMEFKFVRDSCVASFICEF